MLDCAISGAVAVGRDMLLSGQYMNRSYPDKLSLVHDHAIALMRIMMQNLLINRMVKMVKYAIDLFIIGCHSLHQKYSFMTLMRPFACNLFFITTQVFHRLRQYFKASDYRKVVIPDKLIKK